MSEGTGWAALGAIGDAFGGLLSYDAAKQAIGVDKDNLQFQKDKWEYDKGLQETIFAREDNSIQRRVDDLKAAGLSPVLAAGQGARAGNVVQTKAPQQGTGGLQMKQAAGMKMAEVGRNFMEMAAIDAQIKQTHAQTSAIEESTRQTSAEINKLETLLGAELKAIRAQTNLTNKRATTETEAATNQRLTNEYLSSTMDYRVAQVKNFVREQKIDIDIKNIDKHLKGLDKERLDWFHSYMKERQEDGYLYTPEMVDLAAASVAERTSSTLLNQLLHDLRTHYKHTPYSGRNLDPISALVSMFVNMMGGDVDEMLKLNPWMAPFVKDSGYTDRNR